MWSLLLPTRDSEGQRAPARMPTHAGDGDLLVEILYVHGTPLGSPPEEVHGVLQVMEASIEFVDREVWNGPTPLHGFSDPLYGAGELHEASYHPQGKPAELTLLITHRCCPFVSRGARDSYGN